MLTVKIKQLGYIQNAEYTFEEGKLSRLYAPSGRGKSTFCRAIYWALYGQESNILPLNLRDATNVAEVPAVNLIYNKPATETNPGQYLFIMRHNNPQRLLVYTNPQANPLTGVEAQEYINQIWGPSQYGSGMYLEQGEPCTFLTLNDKQKLDFLLHLQYRNSKVQALQARIDESLKETRDQLRVDRNILDRDVRTFSAMSGSVDYSQCASQEQIERWQAELQLLQSELPQLEQRLTTMGSQQARQQQHHQLTARQSELQAQLVATQQWQQIRTAMQQQPLPVETGLPSTELSISEIDNYLMELERWQRLAQVAGLNLNPQLPQQLQQLVQQRDAAIAAQTKHQELQRKITPYANIQEYRRQWEQHQERGREFQRLRKLPSKQEFEQTYNQAINRKHKLELDLQSLECPQCKTTLNLSNGCLIASEHVDKHAVQSNLDAINTWLAKASEQRSNIERRTTLECLLNQSSTLCQSSESDLISLEQEFQSVQPLLHINTQRNWTWPVNYDQQSLAYNIVDLKRYRQQLVNYTDYQQFVTTYGASPSKIKQQYEQQCHIRTTLTEIESQLKQIGPLNQTETDHNYVQQKLTQTRQRQQNLWTQIQAAQSANQIQARHQALDEQRRVIVSLEQKEQHWLSIQAKFTNLLNQRLEHIVNIFNDRLDPFLKLCFTGRQISAQIKLIKVMRNKTIRYKINLVIMLDGHEYSKYTFLSGGEQSRLSLAMTLTFAHLIPNPLLVIDEILGPLDPERTLDVLSRLGEFVPKNKICIIADHHSPASFFDRDYHFQF